MPVHDWSRVSAGTFHDFHNSWITHLKETLNGGILPAGFYAMSEQRAGEVVADVLTLKGGALSSATGGSEGIAVAEAPPKVRLTMVPDENVTYRQARRTLSIRHTSHHRVVALLEIVSPANKDRAASVEEFADKAVLALEQGVHVLVVDLHAPGPHDPQGMHGAIWRQYDLAGYSPPEGKPLTLVSYAAAALPKAYVEPIGLGDALPDMPLFLHPERYVNTPLEPTYLAAYRGLPAYWRGVVEGRIDA